MTMPQMLRESNGHVLSHSLRPGQHQTCAAQIYGFTFTTIAKGAFLIRASIIFTPILCTIAGEAVPVGLWVGALTGFAGSIMISLDPSKADGAAATAAAGVSHALLSGSAWQPLSHAAWLFSHMFTWLYSFFCCDELQVQALLIN